MVRSRVAAGLFAASAVIAASLLGAGPASAATLPTGATIDVLSSVDGGINKVNPLNAVGALVGAAPLDASVNAIDVSQAGIGYAVGNSEGSYLYSANAVTGVISYIDKIVLNDQVIDGCQAIDLSNAGVITVSCLGSTDGGNVSTIGTVTPAGVMTEVATFPSPDLDIVRSLASNSAGVMYFITEFGEIYTLNMTTGDYTKTADVAMIDGAPGRILGADFDITDQLWVTIGAQGFEVPPEVKNTLGTLDVTTGALTIIAPYSSAADPLFDTVMITVWGGYLSATGSTALDFVPIAIGALLLLLAGVALAVTRRITHHRRHNHHPTA